MTDRYDFGVLKDNVYFQNLRFFFLEQDLLESRLSRI